MEKKSSGYFRDVFLLSYSALTSEANLHNYNSFPTAFSFFWASKSNIAVKSVVLQHERKEFVSGHWVTFLGLK